MAFGPLLRLAGVGLVVALGAACVVENNPPPPVTTQPGTPVGGGNGGNGNGGTGGTLKPMLVDVDTNVTMTATPGDGVGVFNEYSAGGHWHIWWTCDTNQTSQSCAFDVKITPASGGIANSQSEGFATADTLTTNTDGSIEAVTTTSTGAEGIRFDTTPGIAITLDANVGGVRSGQFLFFVQKGQVNGGFTGTLTDPLMLEGATP